MQLDFAFDGTTEMRVQRRMKRVLQHAGGEQLSIGLCNASVAPHWAQLTLFGSISRISFFFIAAAKSS